MNDDAPKQEKRSQKHATTEEKNQLSRLKTTLIYEVVEYEGEEELRRPISALWWSGLAAGLSIGFSALAEAYLHAYLPEGGWRPAVENLGYTVGFLIVILGRQQLFTENTITAVVPLLSDPSRFHFFALLRLWTVVFAANMVGAFLFSTFVAHGGAVDNAALTAARALGTHVLEKEPSSLFVRGILAGWLVASIVWIIPNAQGSKAFIIIILSYLISLGDLAHVIAGSVEVGIVVVEGSVTPWHALWYFLVPVFFGNVVGGTVLFTLLTYGQVRQELMEDDGEE